MKIWKVSLLPFIGIVAYLQASAFTSIVSRTFASNKHDYLVDLPVGKTIKIEENANHHSTSAKRIIEKNPLDSVTGDLYPIEHLPTTLDNPVRPIEDMLYEAPHCKDVELLTSTESSTQSQSVATLRKMGGDSNSNVVVHEGDQFEDKKVWFIRWNRLWLKNRKEFCQIALHPNLKAAVQSRKTIAGKKPSSIRYKVPIKMAEGIYKVGDGEFEMDRWILEKMVEIVTYSRMKRHWIGKQEDVPLMSEGLDFLELHRGDILTMINGVRIDSRESFFSAYSTLRVSNQFTISYKRYGKLRSIKLRLK
jgi:hypothetical protein